MDPLNSPTSPQFLESFHALTNVRLGEGLCLEGGRLVTCEGKTSTAAAQRVERICKTKFHEVDALRQVVLQDGDRTKEKGRRIVALLNDLRVMETAIGVLRGSPGEDVSAVLALAAAQEKIEQAEKQLAPLEAFALDVLADRLPREVRRLLHIERTIPDQIAVERRLLSPSTSIPSASIQSASTNSQQACSEILKFLKPSKDMWLYVDVEGKLFTQQGWGEVWCLHGNLPTTSQVVYNACLHEIAECERHVAESLRIREKLVAAELSLQKIQKLKAAVSQILAKYAVYYSAEVAQKDPFKLEQLGYQTLLDTIDKLNKSLGKLEGLCARKSHMEAATLHQRCAMTVESMSAAAKNTAKDPNDRLQRLREDYIQLESLQNLVRARFEQCCCSVQNFEMTSAYSEFMGAKEILFGSQKVFEILSKDLQVEAQTYYSAVPEICEDFSSPLSGDATAPEASLSEIETYTHLRAVCEYTSELKEKLKTATEIDVLHIIAQIPEKYLNYPEIAAVVKSLELTVRDLQFGNTTLLLAQQRLLQREIDDTLAWIAAGGLSDEQLKRALLRAEALLCETASERRLDPSSYASLENARQYLRRAGYTDLPKVSTERLSIKEITKTEQLAKPYVNQFWKAMDCVMDIAKGLEKTEKERLSTLLKQFQEISDKLENLGAEATLQLIEELQMQMNQASFNLKGVIDLAQGRLFSDLQRQLSIMTEAYNQCTNQRKMLASLGVYENDPRVKFWLEREGYMLKAIGQCNLMFGNASLTTNAFTAAKGHVIDFAAVVVKKMDLHKQICEGSAENIQLIQAELLKEMPVEQLEECKKKFQSCEGGDKNVQLVTAGLLMGPRAEQLGDCIQKLMSCEEISKNMQLIQAELLKGLTAEQLTESEKKLQDEIQKPWIDIVSTAEAKERHKIHPELSWGASHINLALCTPANWTTVRTALIKCSRLGKMHVAVSMNEPLDIELEGGVPAGLRSHPRFEKRPANLMKTTSYLCLGDGRRGIEHVSFRGGQFPTVDAAKKALLRIINEFGLENANHLHINALLTPTALTVIKKDKTLLETHKKNILLALDELIQDSKQGTEEKHRLETLKETLAVSNCGVNEGAVGQSLIPMYLGWHESIGGYCNSASQMLNQAVHEKLLMIEHSLDGIVFSSEELTAQLDLLGPLLQIGQDLEAVFALNHYADATVGQNQFKMPALWKALDALVGVLCYTDCMSGKDRTGKVESVAQEYLDEVDMNTIDHKQDLSEEFNRLSLGFPGAVREAWMSARKIMTSACFKKEELLELQQIMLKHGQVEFKIALAEAIRRKVAAVRDGLGMTTSPAGFMEEKLDVVGGGYFQIGTRGIPVTQPKIKTNGILQQQFPQLAVSSMYMRPDRKAPESERLQFIENRQREAVNRRLSQLSGSLEITRINTGKPGFKVEGGDPLIKHSSGFDLEFVLNKLQSIDPADPNFSNNVITWTGLHELSGGGQQYLGSILKIAQLSMPMDQKLTEWETILQEIAKRKAESFAPKAHIEA